MLVGLSAIPGQNSFQARTIKPRIKTPVKSNESNNSDKLSNAFGLVGWGILILSAIGELHPVLLIILTTKIKTKLL